MVWSGISIQWQCVDRCPLSCCTGCVTIFIQLNLYILNVVRRSYVRNAGMAIDVIMRIAGLVAAGTGRRYGSWRQAWVASAVGSSRTGYSNALVILMWYPDEISWWGQRSTQPGHPFMLGCSEDLWKSHTMWYNSRSLIAVVWLRVKSKTREISAVLSPMTQVAYITSVLFFTTCCGHHSMVTVQLMFLDN